jgi:hypothetical protein
VTPSGRWQDEGEGEPEEDWDPEFGYRRQEIVFIGMRMDRAAIVKSYDGCLLDDTELALGPEAWRAFDDPFPTEAEADDPAAGAGEARGAHTGGEVRAAL